MFHREEDSSGPRVYLRPKESVHIPLKYQSFHCDHTTALQVWCWSVGENRPAVKGKYEKSNDTV